jgi:uncharacterized protein (DUF1015 family)
MLRIRPFEALRPPANRAAVVSSPPYDVVNRAEAGEVIKRHPSSFMRVLRPDATLPETLSPYADEVYKAAGTALAALLADGSLVREHGPHIYLYRQVWQGRRQVGVVCCCHVADYEQNVIRKHEKTRRDKEDDRTRHVLATDCHTGPVFLTYHDDIQIDRLVEDDIAVRPAFHFNDHAGVTHTGWIAENAQAYVDHFARIPCAYVADGHHRSASAARAAAHLRPDDGADGAYSWFLSVLFPASQLTILPYNRTVADLNGLSPVAFIDALGALGTIEPMDAAVEPDQPGTIGVYVDGQWHQWTIGPDRIDQSAPVDSLDCALLEALVFDPLLGIHDITTDARVSFISGIRGTQALQEQVDEGHAAAAFALHPVSVKQLMAVSDANLCMPPKSTWFEPKLRSGLFMHQLDTPNYAPCDA